MESDQKKKYDMLKVGPTHLVLFNAYLYQISRKCLDIFNYSCSRFFICIRLWSIHLFIVFDFWEKLISHDRLIGAPTHSAKNDFRFQLWTKLKGNWQRNYIDIFSIFWPSGIFKVRIVLNSENYIIIFCRSFCNNGLLQNSDWLHPPQTLKMITDGYQCKAGLPWSWCSSSRSRSVWV